MSTNFKENRNLYHTFSRVAIQEGQGVAAAVNKTGHTVTTKDVWADIDKLPKNTTYFGNPNAGYDNLIEVYNKNSTEFSKYVKLYENVELSPVDGSGQDADKNQAWELLVDGKRVKNFIAPTDVFDSKGQPCTGYTLKLFDKAGTQIAATDGNWAFDYVAGLVIFERGKTPQDMSWAGTAKGAYIRMSAWAYVGDYLADTLSGYDTTLSKYDLALSGYTTPLAISSEFKNVRELITNVQSEALGIEAGNGIVFGSNISGDTVINVDIANDDKVLSFSDTGLLTTISLVKLSSPISGYAASYQLQGLNGAVLGDTINIAKDQFLKGAEITEGAMISGEFTSKSEIEKLPEDEQVETKKFIHFTFEINKKDEHGKVTSEENNVYLNIHELIDVYTGGNAIEVTSNNVINLVKSNKSEDFFFIDSTGAGVSGVQAAIDLAANSIISGVNKIPDTVTGFKYNTLIYTEAGETAIVAVKNDGTNEIIDISEENVNEITESTISSAITTVAAVTGYVKETISGILPDAKQYADDNFLKEVEVSGAEAFSITEKANNKQTVSLAISTQPGNAIVDAVSGLFVQKYVAGENITLSANANGEMTINGSNSYVLPVATDTSLGGVKAGTDISVDETGEVTVLAASQVKQSLSFGDKIYNGSLPETILASDLGALTKVNAGNNGIIVSDKNGTEQSISLNVKTDDKYLEITSNGLASKGIDEAITGYVDPKVNFLSGVLKGYDGVSAVINADIALANAIVQEAENRNNDVSFLSSVLSGYDTVSAVINADIALSDRLNVVEGQLGGGTGSGSVTEKIKFLSGVLSGYDTVSAVINADLTEKSERQAADSYLSGVLCGYTAEGAVKAAADTLSTRISTIENWKGADGLQIVKAATPTPGYAATYKLADSATGVERGAVINIPKDQFLSGAVYNSVSETLDLTFAIKTKDADGFETDAGHTVSIPASSFVHEYQAGSGLIFNAANTTFNIQLDSNSEEYLYVTENGIGLSGIQEALNGVTTSVENTIAPAIDFLSGVLSAYTEEGAVSSAISSLDARLDVLEGAENVSGSVQYAVKTKAQFADYTANGTAGAGTIQYAIRQNTDAINTLNGDKDTVGSVDYKIDQYDQTISTLVTNITALKNEIK